MLKGEARRAAVLRFVLVKACLGAGVASASPPVPAAKSPHPTSSPQAAVAPSPAAPTPGAPTPSAPTPGNNFSARVRCEGLPQKSKDELWTMSECFFKIGDSVKAAEILRKLSREFPRELKAYFAASWLLWQSGRTLNRTEETAKTLEALGELERARVSNPNHWEVDVEMGDFYSLRLRNPEKAYVEYERARKHYDGDYARSVPKAVPGMKAAIENRIARVTEKLGRNGEAVEASCRALFYDPDDKAAKERVERLSGSCVRKQVKDPRK